MTTRRAPEYADIVQHALRGLSREDVRHSAANCGRGGRVYANAYASGMNEAHGVLYKVVDADTVHVLCLAHAAAARVADPKDIIGGPDECTLLRVRVRGIDAPEMSKATKLSTVERIWGDTNRAQHRAGVRARWLATLYLGSAGVVQHPVYDTAQWQRRVWPDADELLLKSPMHRQSHATCPMVRLTWKSTKTGGAGPPLDAYGRCVADVHPWSWTSDGEEQLDQLSLSQHAVRHAYAKPYTPSSGAPRRWTDEECGAFPLTSSTSRARAVFLDDSEENSA